MFGLLLICTADACTNKDQIDILFMESYQQNEIFVKTLWVCSFMFGKQNKKEEVTLD